ncbi:XTP/dITP diphosphatase [Virgibacillus sp. C22-A2]|uniref:dITP/XTP pyrophosphatase n=1 Tax=Virgibacillus tibetensis TaxID=3042313 RepID=A0ABU6KA93_9BACI|nr:XTP/dITP diphosphatase [Virgibacillus sp. C22-A2]
MQELVIATKNEGKAKEFKDFFARYGIKALSLLELNDEVPDIEENGTTFEENAALKAEQISAIQSTPVLADDSGLIIDSLNGRPGIYSARYAGVQSNDQANIEKVLDELTGVPIEKRDARFICVLAIAIPNKPTIFKTGFCEGKIAFTAEGKNGFGYDPIFIPSGYTKTMAQLSSGEKNKISHRYHAIQQLEEWIKNI